MNITINNIDPVNAIIKIEIAPEDYTGEVEKSLKNLRQKANVPGFRKGMVPMGMIQKMYGKSVLAETINKAISDKLFGFIRENKLNVLGEPLPNETEQKEINFETQDTFEFCFDVALAPEIKLELSKKDKLPYYTIAVDDEMLDQQINSYKANYGIYNQVDEATEEKDMLKGTLIELEDGAPKNEGLTVENAVLMPTYIKNQEEKDKFKNAKKNSVIVFNPTKAYEGKDVEISSLLKIKKNEVPAHPGDFNYEIHEITRYAEAEINQELFDKVFGEGNVKSEEEFKNKVRASLEAQYIPNSDYKFLLDARNLLNEKIKTSVFPDQILKRWILASNKERTPESLEEEYPKIVEDLKFHLIKEEIVKENDIKIEENDLIIYARRAALSQFAQYGMANVPEDILDGYAKDMLKKQENVRNLIDRAVEDKIVSYLKEKIELEPKQLSSEEFRHLFE